MHFCPIWPKPRLRYASPKHRPITIDFNRVKFCITVLQGLHISEDYEIEISPSPQETVIKPIAYNSRNGFLSSLAYALKLDLHFSPIWPNPRA